MQWTSVQKLIECAVSKGTGEPQQQLARRLNR